MRRPMRRKHAVHAAQGWRMGGGKRFLCPLRTDTCNGVAYAYIRKTRRKQGMNEELRKLLDSIRAKKQEVKDLCGG